MLTDTEHVLFEMDQRRLKLNILAIGAHPDDIELGCGGLLIKAVKQGHNVSMYTITNGSHSGDPVQRVRELKQSAGFIGAQNLFTDTFEDTKLESNSDLINHIEFVINVVKADIVYTHSLVDTHHDHKAIAESTIEAGRYVPNLLAYEMPMTLNFKPQVYYDISDVIDEKIGLINLFLSQKEKTFVKANAIKGLAQYRALQSRLSNSITSVESFEVLKLAFEQDFRLLKTQVRNTSNYWNIKDIVFDELYPALKE
jgi:LmbE family N-acetylglucosaminyl deacetylase